jgi:hypothetical protein
MSKNSRRPTDHPEPVRELVTRHTAPDTYSPITPPRDCNALNALMALMALMALNALMALMALMALISLNVLLSSLVAS